MSLPYFRGNGWDPVVLTVGTEWQGCSLEQDLAQTVPPDVRVVYTRAFPTRWARLVGVGNLGLRAWPFLLWRGMRLLRREKFDLVFFSTTQFIAFSLGPIWKRCLRVPYVLDVQDPWRTDYYERPGVRKPPGGWKYQFARLQALLMEGWCFRNAGAIMSVSARYLDDLRARYPEVARIPAAVLQIGTSRADFAVAAEKRGAFDPLPRDSGEKHLVYTGAAGPVMPHALTVLFMGLRSYRERFPEKAGRLRLHFVGTSYVPQGRGRLSVLPLARDCGVGDLVNEVPHRIGYLDAMRLQLQADLLLLLGSSDLAYSPSKMYQYFLTGRPILALVFRESVMESLLDELRCAFMVRFREDESKDGAYVLLRNLFDQVIDGVLPDTQSQRNHSLFNACYLAEGLTVRQCALFAQALVGPS